MAAANIIARFESKLESQTAGLAAKFDAQMAGLAAKFDAQTAELAGLRDQLRRERAVIWMLVALIGAAVMRYLIVG